MALEGRWVNSHELRAGDLLIGQNGRLQRVLRIEQEYAELFPVSNLTIEDQHTFAVGPDALLVHNTSGCSLQQAVQNATRGGVYVLRDAETNQVMRSGRTMDLLRRRSDHARDSLLKKYLFDTVYHTDDYVQLRGLEQFVNELYDAPLDKIRAISLRNPRLQEYLDAAKEFLNL